MTRLGLLIWVTLGAGWVSAGGLSVRVDRLLEVPIVTAASHPSIGANIQGPSLIKVPAWVPEPLGRYYLYFADHKGAYVRLAYSDHLLGPWTIHPPGSLQIEHSEFPSEPPETTPEQISAARERLRTDPAGYI